MSKNEIPDPADSASAGHRAHRGARLLAPAALAACLAGGADASAADDHPAESGSQDEKPDSDPSYRQLSYLAEHPDSERRQSLAALLPEMLLQMRPIERVELMAGWAVSPSPDLRLAIARALRTMAPVLRIPGSLTAIEHLAGDPDPAVRVAIAEAAWLRRREDPARLIAVLHRLAQDQNLFIREVARLALGDT